MALIFQTKPNATIKAKSTTGDTLSIGGVTTGNISPTFAATQINKVLYLGGKAIVADNTMTRTQIEEAVDDE